MNTLVSRSWDSASPRMIMLSACLHGLCVLAIVIVSYHVTQPQKPQEETVMRAKLVEAAPGPPVADKVPEIPAGVPDIMPQDTLAQTEAAEEPSPTVRSMVDEQTLTAPAESIRVAKRKKPMRRVEKPKPAEKKPEPAVAKKEDPSAYVQKQIAELRKEVANRATDAAQQRASTGGGDASVAAGRGGFKEGAETVDRELFLWFAQVRNRINARWSVFGDSRHQERETIVGVEIAEDGSLKGASVSDGSGDEVFDRSAMRAVHQAAPFPKIPPEVAEKIRKAGGLAFRFTVKGMQ